MSGELSLNTITAVATGKGINPKRKQHYRKTIPDLLEKYKDYEVHLAGHSYGAVNLMQLIIDGYVSPETLASTYVVNSPIIRDRAWLARVEKYTAVAPKSFWNIQAQFDFGLGSVFGENNMVTDVWNPYLHFLNNEQTFTVAYDPPIEKVNVVHSS